MDTVELEVAPQYQRSKGAPWFEAAYKKEVLILGQGGISSWLSILMARTGATLYTYDMDSFEAHNLNGAFASQDSIGKPKVEAIKELLETFSPDTEVYPSQEKYTSKSPSNEVVLTGFDNMMARKVAFENWLKVVEESDHPEQCLYMDGRLTATFCQIYIITGDRKDLIEKYKAPDILFDDDFLDEGDCTFRQTSHTAAIIAGHMVGFYTNWLSNVFAGGVTALPFFFEYTVPFNFVKNE